MQPDHIAIAGRDFAELERFFCSALDIPEGELHRASHKDVGTRAVFAPSGGASYVEVIAPDPRATVESVYTQAISCLNDPAVGGFGMRTRDLEHVIQIALNLGLEISSTGEGTATDDSGKQGKWSDVDFKLWRGNLIPFFIDYRVGDDERAAKWGERPHSVAVEEFIITSPDADELRNIYKALDIDVPIVQGERFRMDLTVSHKGRTLVVSGGAIDFSLYEDAGFDPGH